MYKVAIECGQSFWRLSSWARHPSSDNVFRFRKLGGHGFAVGPVMIYRSE